MDCRVWSYQGDEYTIPPKELIVNAILQEVYGGDSGETAVKEADYSLPDNLKTYFEAMGTL